MEGEVGEDDGVGGMLQWAVVSNQWSVFSGQWSVVSIAG